MSVNYQAAAEYRIQRESKENMFDATCYPVSSNINFFQVNSPRLVAGGDIFCIKHTDGIEHIFQASAKDIKTLKRVVRRTFRGDTLYYIWRNYITGENYYTPESRYLSHFLIFPALLGLAFLTSGVVGIPLWTTIVVSMMLFVWLLTSQLLRGKTDPVILLNTRRKNRLCSYIKAFVEQGKNFNFFEVNPHLYALSDSLEDTEREMMFKAIVAASRDQSKEAEKFINSTVSHYIEEGTEKINGEKAQAQAFRESVNEQWKFVNEAREML